MNGKKTEKTLIDESQKEISHYERHFKKLINSVGLTDYTFNENEISIRSESGKELIKIEVNGGFGTSLEKEKYIYDLFLSETLSVAIQSIN